MPKHNDAMLEAAGILSANKLRQLEKAGLTVVRRDELERLKRLEEEVLRMITRWTSGR